MENNTSDDQTTSFYGQRGAGGKLRKPPRKRTPNTPYSRPHQSETPRHNRWFSKLVDPAYRLISGGANYIFPSFFSKSESVSDPEYAPDGIDNDKDVSDANCGPSLNNVASSSKSGEKLKGVVVVDGDEIPKLVEKSGHDGVDDIEKLIKDKSFSRDEVNRLLEIIRSRANDDVDINGASKLQENKYSSPLLKNAGDSAVLPESSRKHSETELGNFNRATLQTPTPLFQSSRNDVGASPIDIAKAYMENRTQELGGGSMSLLSIDKGVSQHDDMFTSKPSIPLPSPKPSICWPGAMAQDHRSYKTPLRQRERYGLHSFSRTPYSRSIGSKSTSKLLGDSDRHLSTMPSNLQRSQASPYGQVGSRANIMDPGRGSVGPIRRTERKVSETLRAFSYFQTPVNKPSQEENSSPYEREKPSISSKLWSEKSKAQNPDISVPTVPTHSREVARKILEHLERNPPTPKDKLDELRLATSWRKPQSAYATTSKTSRNSVSSSLGGLDSIQELETAVQQKNLNDGGVFSLVKAPQANADKAGASVSNNSTSGVKFNYASLTHSSHSVPPLDFSKSQDSQQLLSTHADLSNAVGSEHAGLQKKPPSSGTKPVLPAISITKHGQRLAFPMDNNSGFTFPISASSTVSSEPPTPSIMPSSTAGGLQGGGDSTPLYNFGSNRSTPAIVFSFPSSSNAPTSNDSSDLKFKFGSEQSTRISFASVAKDSICY